MPSIEFASLPGEEGMTWLMRPVVRGMCKMESLKDTTLDLNDVALMNDMLDIEAENQFRLQKALEEK